MLSAPVYLSVGDEYDKRPEKKQPPHSDKPFTVPAKRHPHLLDSASGPYVSLSTGDPYQSTGFTGPFRASGKSASGGAEKPPFRPTNRAHKSSSKGDYYGTFSERNPIRHEAELPPLKGADKDGLVPTKKNFVVNRPKKGTYGFTGLTIAQAGEVQYVSDPYEGNQRVETLKKKEGAARQMGAPFRAAVRHTEYFDETEHGYTKVYALSKPLPPKKSKPEEAKPVVATPWRPGGALVTEITKFPEYQEDPYDVKERQQREERQADSKYKSWTPAGTDPYAHIYTYPVQYNPPPVV